MTVNEAHFQVKSRTRLMGLVCMLSGHKLKSDESSIKTCTVLGKSWSLDLFCEQVCVLWNRKRRLTFEPWEDGCRHRFYSTLPHLWQDTSAALISSSLPVIEVNSNSRLTLQSFKEYNGKRKIHALYTQYIHDLICFLLKWSSGNRLNSLAAIRCDRWQKFLLQP